MGFITYEVPSAAQGMVVKAKIGDESASQLAGTRNIGIRSSV